MISSLPDLEQSPQSEAVLSSKMEPVLLKASCPPLSFGFPPKFALSLLPRSRSSFTSIPFLVMLHYIGRLWIPLRVSWVRWLLGRWERRPTSQPTPSPTSLPSASKSAPQLRCSIVTIPYSSASAAPVSPSTPALMAPASASNTFPTGLFNTYIDIDYSTLIAEQKIKVVEGCEIKRMNPCSITLNNDTELKADEIVSVRNTISEYEGDRSLGMGWRIVWGLCEVSMKKEKWGGCGDWVDTRGFGSLAEIWHCVGFKWVACIADFCCWGWNRGGWSVEWMGWGPVWGGGSCEKWQKVVRGRHKGEDSGGEWRRKRTRINKKKQEIRKSLELTRSQGVT